MNRHILVILGNVVVLSICALVMPFMPPHENGDPIGVAAFTVGADFFYLMALAF